MIESSRGTHPAPLLSRGQVVVRDREGCFCRIVFIGLTVGHTTRTAEVTMLSIKGAVAFMFWLAAASTLLSLFDTADED